MSRSPWLPSLVLLGLALGPGPLRADSSLGLLERFGPDGLPFTLDDPLQVGAHSSSVRFGALGGDACSEETSSWAGGAVSAHGHAGSHPVVSETETEGLDGNHRARPSPADFAGGAFVLDAPFDTTLWIAGTNLDNGQVGRFRVFPTMMPSPDEWIAEIDKQDPDRGWVDGWGSADENMGNVVSGGVKNLHIASLGLAYRDVKQKFGFANAVKYPTTQYFPEFRDRMAGKIERVDMFSQESYLEAWVTEIQNLDTSEAGVSGRFVLDLAGLQINSHMGKYKKSKSGCKAVLDPYFLDMGGPVNEVTGYETSATPVSDYFVAEKWDKIWDAVEFDGITGAVCDWFKDWAKDDATEDVRDKLFPLDFVSQLVENDEYAVIGLYSGLAGKDEKNPFDKVALGVLKEFGQFRPAEWQHWKHVDESELMIGFEPPSDFTVTTAEETMNAKDAAGEWRYNAGSSFLGKSMMILGNSGGGDRNGLAKNDGTGLRLGDTDTENDQALFETADILRSFAMQWLYVRLDVIDPYALPSGKRVAEWWEADLLIPKDINPAMRIDWPPPNFNFGRSQISSFRAGSGGEPNQLVDTGAEGGFVVSVKPETSLIWKGLICIDPVNRTYSVAGALYRQDPLEVWAIGESSGGPWGEDAVLTWTEPRSLGDSFPSYLENSSGRRWLTAAANQWRDDEWDGELRWGWDFDIEGGGGDMDSLHAQHLSDVGSSTWGAAFAYQTGARDSDGGTLQETGRTGFHLVDQTTDF